MRTLKTTGSTVCNRVKAVIGLLLCTIAVPIRDADAQSYERVLNGTPSVQGAWPWMVSLGRNDGSAADTHSCGGTLIGPRHVLTAAHCVYESVTQPEIFSVTVGRTVLTSTEGRVVAVDGVIVHPQYNFETLDYDLALVHLAESVDGIAYPQLADTNDEASAVTTGATLLGWGYTDRDFPIRPANLQEATVPLYSPEQCLEKMGLDYDSPTMLCAGKQASGPLANDAVDACQGDSGGPLLVKVGESWKVLGIVSWGFACGSDRVLGVYTRVSAFRDWLAALPEPAPFNRSLPYLEGEPEVGRMLTCNPGDWGGPVAPAFEYQWVDVDSGEVFRKGEKIRFARADIGRRVRCSVTATTGNGSTSADTDASGAVTPKIAQSKLAASVKRTVRSVGTVCVDGRCEVILNAKRPIRTVRALVPGKNGRWTEVREESVVARSDRSFAIALPKGGVSKIYVRLVGKDGKVVSFKVRV